MCTTTRSQTTAPREKVRKISKPVATAPPGPPPGLFPPVHPVLDYNAITGSILAHDFEVLKAKNKYKRLPFSLIDYTGSEVFYLGNNDKKQTFVASMAKIGVLFAALWLRKTVRENARKSTATTLSAVLDELTANWSQEEKPFPDRFKKNVVPSKTWPPNLNDIFDGKRLPNGEWQLDFKADHDFKAPNRAASLLALDPFDKMPVKTEAQKKAKRAVVNPLGFRDRLELMIGWSDNIAAASCINALGYQFINGCLEKAGFYQRDETTGGGLWVSRNYDGIQDGSDFQGVSPQGGTAQIVGSCMWLAANLKLIDADASKDWLLMMDKPDYTDQADPIPSYTRSFIGDELDRTQHLTLKKLNSKIGIYYKVTVINGQEHYSDFHYSDVANIVQNDIGLVKYVIAICFSGLTDNPPQVLQDLAFELATIIESAHMPIN
ncbi:hypothetical protein ACFPMF_22985 [Larkinella bovis]|uniref:Uncharacterized protein n=1 Tax=Larkinella bovis TaxID=683041 RepID=A0ABW0IG12_9BACT